MSVNASAELAAVSDYTWLRFSVSAASFSLLLFFNVIINWTIVREPALRRHARFVLVFHLLVSALLHLGTSALFHYQINLGARLPRAACRALIAVLISSGSNILLTLTAMALDRLLAVCHPLRYSAACSASGGRWPWLLGLLTWAVALLTPLGLLLQPGPGEARPGPGEARPGPGCGRERLRGGELEKVVFIGVCALIILYSYVRILVEGRRLGVLNRRNQAGCRTIALHGSQLAVYILPNFVNFALTSLSKRELIQRETKELWAVVIFTFFSLAQCVAPVVYGLRKEELLEQLGHRFPFCCTYFKAVLGWTLRGDFSHVRHRARERTLTAQTIISFDVPPAPEEEEPGPMPVRRLSHDLGSCRGDTEDA